MLKHLMNGGSLLSYALYDGNNDDGADAKAKLREQIAKGNLPEGDKDEQKPNDKSDNKGDGSEKEGDDDDEDGDDEEGEEEKEEDGDKIDETPEQKVEREAKEKEAAKATRKQERMQRRIDTAVREKAEALARVTALEAQLAADPDKTLTAEEIKRQAKAMADEAIAEKNLKDLNERFQKDCDTLQSAAKKVDKEFDDKIEDIAAQFGPIPSFMIGVLSDMENGGEVLAFVANDEDVAEGIWNKSPATMTRKLVEISNKLIEAKKKPKKEISKVPDTVEPVKGARTNGSTVVTEADVKNMPDYVAKRRAQMLERRKQQGYS